MCILCLCRLSRSSVWDKRFIEPTTGFEELQQPLSQDDERRYSRIKPAALDTHTHPDFDPLVRWVIYSISSLVILLLFITNTLKKVKKNLNGLILMLTMVCYLFCRKFINMIMKDGQKEVIRGVVAEVNIAFKHLY